MIWVWVFWGLLSTLMISSVGYLVLSVVALGDKYWIEWQETPNSEDGTDD